LPRNKGPLSNSLSQDTPHKLNPFGLLPLWTPFQPLPPLPTLSATSFITILIASTEASLLYLDADNEDAALLGTCIDMPDVSSASGPLDDRFPHVGASVTDAICKYKTKSNLSLQMWDKLAELSQTTAPCSFEEQVCCWAKATVVPNLPKELYKVTAITADQVIKSQW
jgi:hypothetical protein